MTLANLQTEERKKVLGEKEKGPNRLHSIRPFFFVYAEEIEFLSFENKTWSDSSLGCPQLGMPLLQVLKEGYLIRLRAGKEIYNYHGSGDTPPFLCQQPLPQISITNQAPFIIRQTPTISVPPPSN